MSSCSNYTLKGIAKSCDASKGGVVDIYVATFDSISGISYESGNTEVVSAITMNSGKTFYHFNIRKGTASFTSTLNVDAANGVNFVSTELTMQFTRMEAAKRTEMKALALNELVVIAKDANGNYWLLGEQNPVLANGGASQTGAATSDGNFYQITLVDENDTYPKQVLASAFTFEEPLAS